MYSKFLKTTTCEMGELQSCAVETPLCCLIPEGGYAWIERSGSGSELEIRDSKPLQLSVYSVSKDDAHVAEWQ